MTRKTEILVTFETRVVHPTNFHFMFLNLTTFIRAVIFDIFTSAAQVRHRQYDHRVTPPVPRGLADFVGFFGTVECH